MKQLFLMISVFVIIISTDVYGSEVTEPETFTSEEINTLSGSYVEPPSAAMVTKSYPDIVLDNPDASVEELLRAILMCVKDLDVYVQFFVTLVFAIGLTYFIILKPLRYFLY